MPSSSAAATRASVATPARDQVRGRLLDRVGDRFEHAHEVGPASSVERRRSEQQVEPRPEDLRGEEHGVALPVAQHVELPVHARERGPEEAVVGLSCHGQRTEAFGIDRTPALGEPAEHHSELLDGLGIEARHPAGGTLDTRDVVGRAERSGITPLPELRAEAFEVGGERGHATYAKPRLRRRIRPVPRPPAPRHEPAIQAPRRTGRSSPRRSAERAPGAGDGSPAPVAAHGTSRQLDVFALSDAPVVTCCCSDFGALCTSILRGFACSLTGMTTLSTPFS